jgi:hypothetical protein
MMTIPERVDETHADEQDEPEVLYCTVHPTVQTTLRCNRCGRPMCTKCAVKTPVGYRCRECVREQQDKFFNAQVIDYIVATGISLAISFFAAAIVARIWFLFAIFLGPAAGGVIGTVVWRATGKRRGRYTSIFVGTAVVAGALPFVLLNPLSIAIYLFLATGAAVARFRLAL